MTGNQQGGMMTTVIRGIYPSEPIPLPDNTPVILEINMVEVMEDGVLKKVYQITITPVGLATLGSTAIS
jgi:hypothetical protein